VGCGMTPHSDSIGLHAMGQFRFGTFPTGRVKNSSYRMIRRATHPAALGMTKAGAEWPL
jgi:hypothetical protein